jgi:CPA2 family monovalent cation:H+ antiporter-2
MIHDPTFFRDLAYVFLAAILGGGLAWMARQPLVLGYVLGGILIGPFTPGPVISDVHTFELFAEIGIVLLMFSIGIEFSFNDLMQVKWVAIAGGPLGILLSIGLAASVGSLIGWSSIQSIVIGAVISVASTMVLARLLLDRGEIHSRHGRVMVGITLVEDLAVVAMTVLLPTLGAFRAGAINPDWNSVGASHSDPCPIRLPGRKSHPSHHESRRQNAEPGTDASRSFGDRPRNCGTDTDGWTFPCARGIPCGSDRQRI